jgi:hypothetical protein
MGRTLSDHSHLVHFISIERPYTSFYSKLKKKPLTKRDFLSKPKNFGLVSGYASTKSICWSVHLLSAVIHGSPPRLSTPRRAPPSHPRLSSPLRAPPSHPSTDPWPHLDQPARRRACRSAPGNHRRGILDRHQPTHAVGFSNSATRRAADFTWLQPLTKAAMVGPTPPIRVCGSITA